MSKCSRATRVITFSGNPPRACSAHALIRFNYSIGTVYNVCKVFLWTTHGDHLRGVFEQVVFVIMLTHMCVTQSRTF